MYPFSNISWLNEKSIIHEDNISFRIFLSTLLRKSWQQTVGVTLCRGSWSTPVMETYYTQLTRCNLVNSHKLWRAFNTYSNSHIEGREWPWNLQTCLCWSCRASVLAVCWGDLVRWREGALWPSSILQLPSSRDCREALALKLKLPQLSLRKCQC